MLEIRLGKKIEGGQYEASILYDGIKAIDASYFEPSKPDKANALYLMATGLGGDKLSMNLPGRVAAKLGYAAFAISYPNKGFKNALAADARDISRSLEALQAYFPALPLRVLALSKAGRTSADALAQTSANVQMTTHVVPAGFILEHHLSWLHGLRRVSTVAPELIEHGIFHPLQAAELGRSALRNLVARPFAVLGEMHELRHGDIHHKLYEIKQKPEAPLITYVGATKDKLLLHRLQEASVVHAPIDMAYSYEGGHTDLITKPNISQGIYSANEELLASMTALASAA